MYKINMRKKILISFIFLQVILILGSGFVSADDIQSLSTLNIDTSITVKDTTGFGDPTQIIVTPVFINNGTEVNTDKWVRGIYYYTIDKLGFQNIPFHYLITEDGGVFKGNSSGDEKKINIEGIGDNAVVVGYLSTDEAGAIAPASEQPLSNLLLNIANQDSINPENISASGINFIKDSSSNTITIQKAKVGSEWSIGINKIVNNIKNKYSPITKKYSVEITQVTLPTNEITPGDEATVSIKIKNTGKNGFYSGANSEILLTKDNGISSNFYINNTWLSQTQTGIMSDGISLLPGEEKGFDFKVKAPLATGDYSENFILKTAGGTTIKSNKNIELKIKLKKTNKQIIEIKTSYDYVNVRSKPYDSAPVLRKVTAGERYFLLDLNEDTLWAKIDLGGGVEGYLPAWDLKYI